MVLLLASFYEFTLFLKIVLWIAIPLILVSFTVTTILHYRQKKKNALKAEHDPELPVDQVVDISLVSRLQKEVVHYKRRIRELQHALSFAKEVIPPATLDSKVASLQQEVSNLNDTPALSPVELPQEEFSPAYLTSPVATAGMPVTNGEAGVDESPASSAYLQDLVNEQKTHVLFLQQQLESRIKGYHELEYQFRDKAAQLEKMTLSYEHIKHQLNDQKVAAAAEKSENEKLRSQVKRLEASLQELQEQHNKSLRLLDHSSAISPETATVNGQNV